MRLDHLLSKEQSFLAITLFSFEGSSSLQKWAYSSDWLERTPDKREVGGSTPPKPTIDSIFFLGSSTVEHPAVNRVVVGSNPTRGAILVRSQG